MPALHVHTSTPPHVHTFPSLPPATPPISSFDLAAVAEAGDALTAAPDADFLLASLLRVAMGRLLAMRGAVFVVEEGAAEGAGLVVAAVRGSVGLAVGDRVALGGASLDEVQGDALPAALRAVGLALMVPLRYRGVVAGVLALGPRATGEPHDPSATAYVRSLSGIAAAALAATRTATALAHAHRDLSARTQAFSTLHEAAQAFAAAPDRAAVLRALGYAVMGQLPADRWALVLDADGPAAARGLRADLSPELSARLAHLDAPLDAATDPMLAAAGLALAVPVTGAERARGTLAVGPRATGRPYTDADRAFLGALGGFAYAALDRVVLVESRVEKERLEEELRLARTIQERLLPRVLPDVPGLDLAVCARPSRVVAGDYHDLVALPGGRLVVAVADVSGKGAPAALLMANVQAVVRLIAPELDRADASGVLEQGTARLNRIITENTAPGTFVTFVWGVWDGRRLTYCNAGHLPPRLIRADGTLEELDAGGPLLGVIADAAYVAASVALYPGDLVALYTDGLTEASNAAGEEFGEGPLDALLIASRGGTAREILDAACAGGEAFSGGPPVDDLTVMVLKVGPLRGPTADGGPPTAD